MCFVSMSMLLHINYNVNRKYYLIYLLSTIIVVYLYYFGKLLYCHMHLFQSLYLVFSRFGQEGEVTVCVCVCVLCVWVCGCGYGCEYGSLNS